MSIQRVALVYSDTPRPETTGYYVRLAFSELANRCQIGILAGACKLGHGA
jgi:hypothetical protein